MVSPEKGPGKASSPPVVQAAGGVLWRRGRYDRVEVALVHRPRYDDWSLPKGKAKREENLLVTALREVEEETGHLARLGPFLTRFSYTPGVAKTAARVAPAYTRPRTSSPPPRPAQRTKVVGYWAMAAEEGAFVPGDEVDDLAWVTPETAREQLSYPLDRTVLDRFADTPLDTVPIVVARAGHTGPGAAPGAPREARHLDARGRAEAEGLLPVLRGTAVRRLLAAPETRCVETLLPAAEELGVPLVGEPLLAEADDPGFTGLVSRLLREASAGSGTGLCVPGAGLEPVLAALTAQALGPRLSEPRVRKGGWWVIHVSRGRYVAAERHDPGTA